MKFETDSGADDSRPVAPTRRSRRSRIALTVGGLIVALIAIAAGAVGLFLNNLVNVFEGQVDVLTTSEVFPAEEGRPEPSSDGALNILLLASDSRGDVAEVAKDPEDTSATDQRSDVLMVVHLSADRSQVQVMSIMRDSFVEVPGHGKAKINAALSWGGTPLAVQSVEGLLGVRIDHVALIGFDGFAQMTDALGGVTVNVPEAFDEGGYRFTAGETTMGGDQALVFVRQRYAFADGDFQRVKNQQAFIRSLAENAVSRGTFTNPAKLSDLVTAVAQNLSVDPELTPQRMIDLGMSMRGLDPASIAYFTVPATGTGMEGDQSVVYLDEASLEQLRTALTNDTVDEFLAARIGE